MDEQTARLVEWGRRKRVVVVCIKSLLPGDSCFFGKINKQIRSVFCNRQSGAFNKGFVLSFVLFWSNSQPTSIKFFKTTSESNFCFCFLSERLDSYFCCLQTIRTEANRQISPGVSETFISSMKIISFFE